MDLNFINNVILWVCFGYLLAITTILYLKHLETKNKRKRILHDLEREADVLRELNIQTTISYQFLKQEKLKQEDLNPSSLTEDELMTSCCYWSKSTLRNETGYVLKCAVNPTSTCKDCKYWKR